MSTKKWYGLADLERKYGQMTLGRFLKAFREADEQSQIDYAHRLGLSRANLCDLEKGRRFASPARAARLAARLGVPEAVLVQLSLQDELRAAKLKYRVELKVA